jgi:hypothetical protein
MKTLVLSKQATAVNCSKSGKSSKNSRTDGQKWSNYPKIDDQLHINRETIRHSLPADL